jgi:copper(I)-binding protein
MPSPLSKLKSVALCAAFTLFTTLPAFAGDITIVDPYARTSGKAGAIYMEIVNASAIDDRLISVSTEIAKVAGLHTHIHDTNGVTKMREVEDGFVIPAGGAHVLRRGKDHVMLMGLTDAIEDGGTVTLILQFERAGEITVIVPVDQSRKPKPAP